MQSRFDFLDDQFPQIAEHARKAEQTLGHDNNICLLNLGRIAEDITDLILKHTKTNDTASSSNNPRRLLEHGYIDEDICTKLETLTQIKEDAENKDYSSQMAAQRLLVTAQELCEWFISSQTQRRFSFMADLFPQADSVPPLAALADFGTEAEDNLGTNTRYSLICLGDVGEFAVDTLMNMKDISIHEKDQLYRINMLFYRGVISKAQRDTLHLLRIARNKAVHQRYASDEEGSTLLDEALELCEWLFRFTMSDGDIVRGNISAISDDGLSVSIGRLRGHVERPELRIDEGTNIRDCYRVGERENFRVLDAKGDDLALSILQVHNDPWNGAMRHYDRYSVGQDVNATVKRITESFGAFVELKGGLEARIPESEYSITARFPTPKLGQQISARIKWLNSRQYPYMLLSIRDIEMEKGAVMPEVVPDYDDETPDTEAPVKASRKSPKKNTERNKLFLDMCKTAPVEDIINALDKGADINAHNHNKMTALMVAAMYNPVPEVISALVERGADVNAQNHKGNTALIFAAMMNSEEVVKALCENGADAEISNNDRKKALHYARNNPKLRSNEEVLALLGAEALAVPAVTHEEITTTPEIHEETTPEIHEETTPEIHEETATEIHEETATEPETVNEPQEELTPEQHEELERVLKLTLKRDFLKICRSGSLEEVNNAIASGVNVNITNKSHATALMFAAQSNTADVVQTLIEAGVDVNAQDDKGNTALIYAASFNSDDAVALLLDAGADPSITNNDGHTAADYANMNYRLADTQALGRLNNE